MKLWILSCLQNMHMTLRLQAQKLLVIKRDSALISYRKKRINSVKKNLRLTSVAMYLPYDAFSLALCSCFVLFEFLPLSSLNPFCIEQWLMCAIWQRSRAYKIRNTHSVVLKSNRAEPQSRNFIQSQWLEILTLSFKAIKIEIAFWVILGSSFTW